MFILVAGAGALFAQHEFTPADIEAGRQQYATNCLRCHGPDGDILKDADIGHGRFRRGSTDDDLVRIIRDGIPGTPMASSNISEPNALTIVAYLRNMAAASGTVAPGDAARGKTIFEGKGGCTSCHRVIGNGSRVGPDLSQIGGARRAVELQRSLVDPDAEIVPANRMLKLVTRDGAAVTGRLLNQDAFTLQLLDSREQLRSFSKSNLREFSFVTNSSMPSYKDKLSSQELADVVSYLASLRGL
jgi:putative heme-binding domain-containing protein